MSCAKCTLAQSEGRTIYPVRIGTGNVFLLGCETHVADVMDLLRERDRSSTRSKRTALSIGSLVPGTCGNCGFLTEQVWLCPSCGKVHRAAP